MEGEQGKTMKHTKNIRQTKQICATEQLAAAAFNDDWTATALTALRAFAEMIRSDDDSII